jgi:hypothetical protein
MTSLDMAALPDDMQRLPDGSLLVQDQANDNGPSAQQFDINLAEVLSAEALNGLSTRLVDQIERDMKSRERRIKQYQDALRRSGLGEDAPGGAQFEGASRVVHPVISEACVDFEASAIKELFPPNGPVKTKVLGNNPPPERLQKAERVAAHMNWQLTEQIPEYRSILEQVLTQVPMGGSQFLKWSWDSTLGRPTPDAVFVDKLYLPYNANNFYSSERFTHEQEISKEDWEKRVKTGFYRDLDISPSRNAADDQSRAEVANDKIEGKSRNDDGMDEDIVIYESYVKWDFEGEDPLSPEDAAPYIVTIDTASSQVLSVYRNWEESDPLRRALEWVTEYPFVPWRGAYSLGLSNLIGGLSAAATGALRALLDSAHINNAVTGLKISQGRTGGQTAAPQIGQVATLESAPGESDPDIRKIFSPMPFNPPSVVLFQLLGWLTDSAKGVVGTAEEKIADASNTMPVGTAQALIEQGSKVFSAIHARLHAAQAKSLAILHRLNRDYLDDKITQFEAGEVLASRQDYQGPMDIVPVSDPNIFSETQRFAQNQALSQLADTHPDIFDRRAVYKRVLDGMKVPNPDEILPPPPKPTPMDPISENLAMAQNVPVEAFPGQDHLGHILAILTFLDNPLLGSNPVMGINYIPHALEHLSQHLGLFYAEGSFQAVGAQFQPGQPLPPQMDMQVTRKLMQAQPNVMAVINQTLGGQTDLAGIVNMALNKLKQFQELQRQITPTPPDDPLSKATIDASLAETARKARQDEADDQLRARELDIEQQDADTRQKKLGIDAAKVQVDATDKAASHLQQRRVSSYQEAIMDDGESPAASLRNRR